VLPFRKSMHTTLTFEFFTKWLPVVEIDLVWWTIQFLVPYGA
jgi:hypothetical protein